ncbi:MAG: hypothetical protein ABIL25_00565 [candidate division WOR-3 bacterium]
MSVPPDLTEAVVSAVRTGYRWELDRAMRANAYLRVFFSSALLLYSGFGPGLLIRFPVTVSEPHLEPLSQFYAFRPAIFALIFAALSCVLAALAQRGQVLFESALAEDRPNRTEEYFRLLAPSPLPFVLSGNLLVDGIVFVIAVAAYAFWVVLLVETTPVVMQAYQVVGVVLGSYGLFAALIVIGFVWAGLVRRSRKLRRTSRPAANSASTRPV